MRLWLMRVVILHLCTKFEVCRLCGSEDMVHDECEHFNGPGDLDL